MSRRVIIGVFDNEHDTIDAIRASRRGGLKIVDVYGPYAVHGIEDAMGLAPSRLPWIVFAMGLAFAALKVWFEFWTTAVDWPINVGGKPFNSLPAFVPVTFEVMVLGAGVTAVLAFLIVCRLRPGKRAVLPMPGVTDDRFAVVLEQSDSTFDVDEVERMFRGHNAVAVEEQITEER
ncbi:MAG: DUF3341 domain-containing protein [Terriglobales bacterium]